LVYPVGIKVIPAFTGHRKSLSLSALDVGHTVLVIKFSLILEGASGRAHLVRGNEVSLGRWKFERWFNEVFNNASYSTGK
jgi:hypothetical protein